MFSTVGGQKMPPQNTCASGRLFWIKSTWKQQLQKKAFWVVTWNSEEAWSVGCYMSTHISWKPLLNQILGTRRHNFNRLSHKNCTFIKISRWINVSNVKKKIYIFWEKIYNPVTEKDRLSITSKVQVLRDRGDKFLTKIKFLPLSFSTDINR